ncbi:MAG TPA: alpha/beta hydrolase [Acidimicrobiia bacterium]|nr:alpha/beta hydrolase [Acidimicrobiia bacterium]
MEATPVRLQVRTWGAGPRRILLLHGISSSADGWWRLASDLADRGWSVTAPDLRGHGRSPAGEDYLLPSYATDVLALGDGWDAVLGHSLGGAVAVLASTRNPAWAVRLVLQDPALILPDPFRAELMRGSMEWYDRPPTAEAVAEANPGWHPEDCRIKAEALRRSSPEMVRHTFEDNDPWNVLAEAATLPCPVVLLGSDPAAGVAFPVTIGEWLGTQPGVEYRMLSGAGHAAHREQAGYRGYLSAVLEALGPPQEATVEA